MTREDVLREFLRSTEIQTTEANHRGQIVFFDCDDMADEIVRLRERVRALEAWASHQEYCRTCAEDGWGSCINGRTLRESAEEGS